MLALHPSFNPSLKHLHHMGYKVAWRSGLVHVTHDSPYQGGIQGTYGTTADKRQTGKQNDEETRREHGRIQTGAGVCPIDWKTSTGNSCKHPGPGRRTRKRQLGSPGNQQVPYAASLEAGSPCDLAASSHNEKFKRKKKKKERKKGTVQKRPNRGYTTDVECANLPGNSSGGGGDPTCRILVA